MASHPVVSPSAAEKRHPPRRPPELQDPLNRYLYHKLSARLARLLALTPVRPNAVSVAGAVCVWLAAWAYAAVTWPYGALLGLLLHMLWHVVDGADGDLARMTGRTSPIGEMVDGLCDYAGHAVLYIVLAAMLDDWIGLWAWPLGVVAAASHAVQTNHAETNRRSYSWWVYGVPWIRNAQAADDAVFRKRSVASRLFAAPARLYLRVAQGMAPWSAQLDAEVAAAAGNAPRLAHIRRTVKRAFRRALVLEKAVGPNPRTIILGLCMLLGSPLWFFLAEIVLLNAVLALSVVHHNAVGRRLVEKLGRSAC